jgi:arylsulfatase A-like enzyme
LAVYYAVITHMDAQIGRMLRALKDTEQLDETLVIFTSDHGLAIGSHGLRGKQNMYEHTVGVPLILSGPGIAAGRRASAQCYLRDLFPTVCELTGIDVPPTVDGKSLKPVLDDTAAEVRPYVVAHFRDSQRMIRDGEWKLIQYPQAGREQLFHLKTDPHERNNLISEKTCAGMLENLRKCLLLWQKTRNDPVLERVENGNR